MTALETALREICADLSELRTPFALVSGLAVSARTEPRFTRDADIAVAVENDAEAEAVVRSLRGAGYRVDALVEQEAVGRLATARVFERRFVRTGSKHLAFRCLTAIEAAGEVASPPGFGTELPVSGPEFRGEVAA